MYRCIIRRPVPDSGRRNRAGLYVSLNTSCFALVTYLNIRRFIDLNVGERKRVLGNLYLRSGRVRKSRTKYACAGQSGCSFCLRPELLI